MKPTVSEQIIKNCASLYSELCAEIREKYVETDVCGMCIFDGDHYIGESGDFMEECPGFEKDDCFKLDFEKFKKYAMEGVEGPDLAPVIRCKDCKFYDEKYSICFWFGTHSESKDYCSQAKEKEENKK